MWGVCIVLFNSYAFLLVFLPLAVATYAVADRFPRLRCPVLIALSLIFYSYWDIRFLPLMIVSIVGNWWLANIYAATKWRSLITVGIAANLLVLGFFKYTNFFALGSHSARLRLAALGPRVAARHQLLHVSPRDRIWSTCSRGRAPVYRIRSIMRSISVVPAAHRRPAGGQSESCTSSVEGVAGEVANGRAGPALAPSGSLKKVFLADRARRARQPDLPLRRASGPVFEAWIGMLALRCRSSSIFPATPTWRSASRACSASRCR